MKQEQILDDVFGLVDDFKTKLDDLELFAGQASEYLKCCPVVLGAKDAVINLN